MKRLYALLVLLSLSPGAARADVPAEEATQNASAVPYLLPNAPTFDLTPAQFRARYNQENVSLPIAEYRALAANDAETAITRAASKINDTLYSSAALEKGTGKIKSLQITYLPPAGDDHETRTQAINYMAAVMRSFATTMTAEQSTARVTALLDEGKGRHYFFRKDGALRYVVSDNGEKGITFAVEPIKLSLSEKTN